MRTTHPLKRLIAAVLVVTTTHVGFVGTVHAALVGTETVSRAAAPEAAAAAHERVAAFLSRPDVADQLQRLGVAPDEARARAAALSDTEITALSDRLDRLPAGGDAIGSIIFAGVLIFLVLLVTDILGYTKVFSFTRPARK